MNGIVEQLRAALANRDPQGRVALDARLLERAIDALAQRDPEPTPGGERAAKRERRREGVVPVKTPAEIFCLGVEYRSGLVVALALADMRGDVVLDVQLPQSAQTAGRDDAVVAAVARHLGLGDRGVVIDRGRDGALATRLQDRATVMELPGRLGADSTGDDARQRAVALARQVRGEAIKARSAPRTAHPAPAPRARGVVGESVGENTR